MNTEIHMHEWWLPHVEEFKESGMTIKGYAESKGLSPAALEYHIRTERNKNKPKQNLEILPVKVADNFVSSRPLDISINGIKVTADPDSIRKILGVQL